MHAALAAYYVPGRKRGPDPWTTYKRLYHQEAQEQKDCGFDVYSEETWVAHWNWAWPCCTGMWNGTRTRTRAYEIVSSEQTFQLPVRVPKLLIPTMNRNALLALPPFTFKAVGTFDGVWRHLTSGRISFKEFKTATAISLDGLPMDEQAGMYWTYGPKWLRRKGLLAEGELPNTSSTRSCARLHRTPAPGATQRATC